MLSPSTGLPTKDETVKKTQNSKNMTIYSLIFCRNKQSNKQNLEGKELALNARIGLNKFRTIVSKVSFFVDNPVLSLVTDFTTISTF